MDEQPDWRELCDLLGVDPEVLDEYGLHPRRLERRGNAVRLTADGATVYIKKLRTGCADLDAVHELTERLVRRGVRVPPMLQNKYGDSYVLCETGDYYVLPQIAGRAVRLDDESEFVEVARALGAWHQNAAAEPGRFANPLRADLSYWWGLARVKLNSYRECALDRQNTTALDEQFLAVREDIDRQLVRALAYLPLVNYGELCRRASERGELCHGNVVRQNLLSAREGVYILDHSHVFAAPQMLDLASYIQRYAARFDWDRSLCASALAAYRQERPLSGEERLVTAVLLAYPEGMLRVLENYYEQRQDWGEEDFLDAFAKACAEDQARIQFLESEFGDQLPRLDDRDLSADELAVPASFAPYAQPSMGSLSVFGDADADDGEERTPFRWGRRSTNTAFPGSATGAASAAERRQELRNGLWRPSS
ncbi:MAG: hypothetical protein ACYCYO_06225 [Bacilli bacterium]